jgi:hypothetical protein
MYRAECTRTTWKFRIGVVALAGLALWVSRGWWTVSVATSLVCEANGAPSDARPARLPPARADPLGDHRRAAVSQPALDAHLRRDVRGRGHRGAVRPRAQRLHGGQLVPRWHGIQVVVEQWFKLQYYRFWVLPRSGYGTTLPPEHLDHDTEEGAERWHQADASTSSAREGRDDARPPTLWRGSRAMRWMRGSALPGLYASCAATVDEARDLAATPLGTSSGSAPALSEAEARLSRPRLQLRRARTMFDTSARLRWPDARRALARRLAGPRCAGDACLAHAWNAGQRFLV